MFCLPFLGSYSLQVETKLTKLSNDLTLTLKAQGHVTVSKPVISIIYVVAHTWPQILVDGVNQH